MNAKCILPLAFFFTLMGCSTTPFDILSTRPKLEMSIAQTALKAAKDANAETLASNHYRRARDHYLAARQAYRRKNFGSAGRHAKASKKYSEEAEYLALKRKDKANSF